MSRRSLLLRGNCWIGMVKLSGDAHLELAKIIIRRRCVKCVDSITWDVGMTRPISNIKYHFRHGSRIRHVDLNKVYELL